MSTNKPLDLYEKFPNASRPPSPVLNMGTVDFSVVEIVSVKASQM